MGHNWASPRPRAVLGSEYSDCLNKAPTCVASSGIEFPLPNSRQWAGNVGRNTFISPGFQTYTLRSAFVQATGARRATCKQILVRGEFLNAFNQPEPWIPSLNLRRQLPYTKRARLTAVESTRFFSLQLLAEHA